MLMSDYHLWTNDLFVGPRRQAVLLLDAKIETAEHDLNNAIDARLWGGARLARNELKALREQRAYLFTCSIHDIISPEPRFSE